MIWTISCSISYVVHIIIYFTSISNHTQEQKENLSAEQLHRMWGTVEWWLHWARGDDAILLSDVMLVSRKYRTLWVFDFCDVRRPARGIYVGIDIHIWRANGPVVPDASPSLTTHQLPLRTNLAGTARIFIFDLKERIRVNATLRQTSN